jgi:hypothetical protein
MGTVLHLLLNLLIILGTIVPFLASAMLIVYRTAGRQERVIRGLAMFTAALLALGTQAAGLTVGRGVVGSLEIGGFGGLVIKLAWMTIAGFGGAMLGRYLTRNLGDSTDIQLRVMVFVGTIVHLELLEIYISSFSRNGIAVGAGAIPVISFIVGLLLYIVFRYDPAAVRRIGRGLPRQDVAGQPRQPLATGTQPPLIMDEEYTDIFGEGS